MLDVDVCHILCINATVSFSLVSHHYSASPHLRDGPPPLSLNLHTILIRHLPCLMLNSIPAFFWNNSDTLRAEILHLKETNKNAEHVSLSFSPLSKTTCFFAPWSHRYTSRLYRPSQSEKLPLPPMEVSIFWVNGVVYCLLLFAVDAHTSQLLHV